MGNFFPGPPAWTPTTSYTANQSEVIGQVNGAQYYFVCASTGTSGSTVPTWASVFGATTTDGTVLWTTVQRARQAWAASTAYTAGLPIQTTGTISTANASVTNIAGGASFIPIGSYVVGGSVTPGTTVTAVTAASTVVLSANGLGTGVASVTFIDSPYPWQDQIITSGSVAMQCIVSGTSGSVQPAWPGASVLVQTNGVPSFNLVNDTAPLQWQAAGYDPSGSASVWTANNTYVPGNVVRSVLYDWMCVTGGTTGAASTQPAWPIVQDGNVVWAVVGVV